MHLLDDILRSYDWYDHPEGMKFVQTHRDAHRTCGHWLFQPGDISTFHRVLNNEELWLIHAGSVLVHVISPAGEHTVLRVGTDFAAGERPVIAIPLGHWQAAEVPEGVPFAYGSNVCAPGFSWDQFELGEQRELLRAFPHCSDVIARLTRKGDLPERDDYERNL
jgi:predicted cupin superfamily sugar epimerase